MMSRFIDKLKQVSQVMPHPMGFRAAEPTSAKPRILLIASLAQADIDSLADRVAGADAGLLRTPKLSSGAKALKRGSQAVSDIPWGGWLEGIAEEEVEPMAKIGFDFVVFPDKTPLAILKNEKVGKILEIAESLSEGLLPAVDELPMDAVLVAGKQDGPLTWQHLMFFQRCADLLTKPLLVFIPSNISTNELQALWETGVSGVVVGVDAGQPVDRLAELRQIIDKLALPSQRKRRKVEALLPHTYISEEADIAEEEAYLDYPGLG